MNDIDTNRVLEACAIIADELAEEHHDFIDGGYEVGRKIAQKIRCLKQGGNTRGKIKS